MVPIIITCEWSVVYMYVLSVTRWYYNELVELIPLLFFGKITGTVWYSSAYFYTLMYFGLHFHAIQLDRHSAHAKYVCTKIFNILLQLRLHHANCKLSVIFYSQDQNQILPRVFHTFSLSLLGRI